MIGVHGELSVMPLADVIIWLGNRAMTGTLTVERSGIKKLIKVERGAVVRVDSNSPREALGQHLVNFGLVTEDQLNRAFKVQQETNVLLGRILVMIGIVQEEHVIKTLDFLIRETVLDALRWKRGRFAFAPEVEAETRPDIDIAVPLLEIHREGARRAQLWDQFRSIFESPSMTLMVATERITTAVPTESYDGRILSLAQLGLSIEAIAMETHSTDFHLYARLYDLYGMGIIEAKEPSNHNTGDLFKLTTPVAIDASSFLAGGGAYQSPAPAPPAPPAGTQTGDLSRRRRSISGVGINPMPGNTPTPSLHTPGRTPVPAVAIGGTPAPMLVPSSVPAPPPIVPSGPTPSSHAVPSLISPLQEILKRRMSASERYILTRIDGARTIGSIMQVSPMSDQEALAIFQKLAKEGVIRI